MGGAEGSNDDELAFGAGGAIMEALAQSDADIGSTQPPTKSLKATKKLDNKTGIKSKLLNKKKENV